MITTLTLVVCLALVGQEPPTKGAARDSGAERLAFMKDSVKVYRFEDKERRESSIVLRPEPAFRLGMQGDGVVLEGAIFLWADEVGRPEAAAQVFLARSASKPEGEWLHEFTSLSTSTFVATQTGKPRWMPLLPGVSFQPVPGAPKPADTPALRLRQLRAMADEFRAEDDFWGRGWQSLRLLPTPVARYGKSGGTPEDGALFAFVLGTDPEAFLFIEARPRPEAGGLEWQYAWAPMTCWGLKADHKGRPVWGLGTRNSGNMFRTFFSRPYLP